MKQLLMVVVLVFVGAVVYAQGTPDGETPANEGVCDDLMYSTPGLYGLCIAFCEAQDCVPDFSAEDPYELCNPSSDKLLRNYRRKMQPGDLDMPCIAPPPSCPCWTLEEVASLRFAGEIKQCGKDREPSDGYNFDYWQFLTLNDTPWYAAAVGSWQTWDGGGVCTLNDGCEDGDCLQLIRYLPITLDEFLVCEEQIAQTGAERGFICWD